MTVDCQQFRNRIPRALLGDLTEDQARKLELHLAECPACRDEQKLYEETVDQLRLPTDEPAPRHFFVYPERGRATRLETFRDIRLTWRSAAALAVAALLIFVSLSRVEMQAEGSSVTIRIGNPPVRPSPTPPAPGIDVAALRSGLARTIEESLRVQKSEILQTLRQEISGSESRLTRRQRALLRDALAGAESRMDEKIVNTAALLGVRTESSLTALYQHVESGRSRDLAAIHARFDQIAAEDALKNNQTDAILETLLQVAELRVNR